MIDKQQLFDLVEILKLKTKFGNVVWKRVGESFELKLHCNDSVKFNIIKHECGFTISTEGFPEYPSKIELCVKNCPSNDGFFINEDEHNFMEVFYNRVCSRAIN